MVRLVILRVLESYFRHRWLYLLPTVLMMAAAAVSFVLAKPVYVANGVFFVQQESLLASLTAVREAGYSWQTPAQETTNEFNELMQTNAFIRSMIRQTHLEIEMDQGPNIVDEIIGAVRKDVWLQPLGNNQIRINAAHEDPLLAQQLVSATIETYIQWKINAEMKESQAAQAFFADLLETYKAELDTARQNLDEYLMAHPAPLRGDRLPTEQLQIDRLQSEIDLAQTRYASVLDKDENARLAAAQAENDVRQTYFLIDAPLIPTEPGTSLKESVVNLAMFVVVGAMLSGMAIAGGALLDRSIRFPIDVHFGLHLPVLTEVPDLTPPSKRWRRKQKKETGEQRQPVVEQIVVEQVDGDEAEVEMALDIACSDMTATELIMEEVEEVEPELIT